jgi:hypothetical protein
MFSTELDVMNESDALESNKIVAGCELVRNIPNRLSYGLPCHT